MSTSGPTRDRAQDALRFLFVYDCIYPSVLGGVEHRNYELGRALVDQGHQVTLAGWAAESSEPHPGLRIHAIGPEAPLYAAGGQRRTTQAARLALHCAQLDPSGYDLVESANIPYVHLLPLAWRARRARVPLLVTWHEYWGANWRVYSTSLAWRLGMWLPYALLERLVSRLGARAVAVSELTRERIANRRNEAVALLRNGIPFDRIRQLARDAEPGGSSLVYAGRFVTEKRIDVLLEAVARMKQREDEEPLLTLIGDGPARPELEAKATSLALGNRVRFAGKLPQNDDVWRETSRARLAVQPSSREGFGLFPLEAMASGLPVVFCSSPESAVGEIVRDGVEGLEVEAEPTRLARALDDLLDSPNRRAQLAAAAVERASAYSWKGVATELVEIARSLNRRD